MEYKICLKYGVNSLVMIIYWLKFAMTEIYGITLIVNVYSYSSVHHLVLSLGILALVWINWFKLFFAQENEMYALLPFLILV